MTEKELLEQVITELNTISVPVVYTEQIANPIKKSVGLLTMLYSAIVKVSEENSSKETTPESDELKLEEPISEEQEVNQNGSDE